MRFLVFGDSICAGSNVPGGGERDAWPYLLPALSPLPLEIVNRSRGGRPTDSLDEFREAIASAGSVDALVIALGANDSRDFSGNCVPSALANIRALLSLARESRILRVILVGPYNINAACWNSDDESRAHRVRNLVALAAAYRDLAVDEALEFVSMYGVVPEASMTFDGVHPSPEGNRPIARRFANAVWG